LGGGSESGVSGVDIADDSSVIDDPNSDTRHLHYSKNFHSPFTIDDSFLSSKVEIKDNRPKKIVKHIPAFERETNHINLGVLWKEPHLHHSSHHSQEEVTYPNDSEVTFLKPP